MTTTTTTATGLTFDAAIGVAVNQYLLTHGLTRAQVGAFLGVAGSNISQRLRGRITWPAEDLYKLAEAFGVKVDDLMPRKVPTDDGASWAPAPYVSVPRTGFEPATFCSGGTLPTPDEDQGSLNLNTFRPTWRLAA